MPLTFDDILTMPLYWWYDATSLVFHCNGTKVSWQLTANELAAIDRRLPDALRYLGQHMHAFKAGQHLRLSARFWRNPAPVRFTYCLHRGPDEAPYVGHEQYIDRITQVVYFSEETQTFDLGVLAVTIDYPGNAPVVIDADELCDFFTVTDLEQAYPGCMQRYHTGLALALDQRALAVYAFSVAPPYPAVELPHILTDISL